MMLDKPNQSTEQPPLVYTGTIDFGYHKALCSNADLFLNPECICIVKLKNK